MHIAQAIVWFTQTCAPTLPFSYLGHGWTDCAAIWCVVKTYQLCFIEVKGGVHLDVRKHILLFCIPGTSERIVLKLGI